MSTHDMALAALIISVIDGLIILAALFFRRI